VTTVTVRKYNWRGEFRYAWQGEVLARDPDRIVIDATWRGPGEPAVGEITFAMGDHFIEYYYPGRAFAIWQVQRPDGTVKGWYCNISTPLVEQDDILRFNDLLLDIVAYPDGRYMVLDRDEFEAAHAAGLPEDQAALAEKALADLQMLMRLLSPSHRVKRTVSRVRDRWTRHHLSARRATVSSSGSGSGYRSVAARGCSSPGSATSATP
jgi:protein associated with RNAse G/E